MIIWILNHYASVPETGGAETRHYEFGRNLAKQGHLVRIFIGSYSHLTDKEMHAHASSFSNSVENNNGPFFHILDNREYKGNGIARLLASRDYYKSGLRLFDSQINEKPDVIIASSPHPYAWKLGQKIASKFKSKYIVEVRDVWPRDLIKSGKLGKYNPVSLLFGAIEKKAYKKSDKIISLLPGLEKHIFKVAGTKMAEKVVFIPNGIELTKFQNPKISGEINTLFKAYKGKTIIAYLGSHGPTNDLRTVIKGINKYNESFPTNNFHFLFVGRGSMKKQLITLVKSLSIDNIDFIDPIPKNFVPGFLNLVDGLIFPLAKFDIETPAVSSYKLLDYMASGKPIISVDLPNFPLKETGGAIFYKAEEEDSFKRALEKYSELKEKGKTLFPENKDYVAKNRDINVLTNKLITIMAG